MSINIPGRGSIFSSASKTSGNPAAASATTSTSETPTFLASSNDARPPSRDNVDPPSTTPIPYHGLLGHPTSSPFPFTRVINLPTGLICPPKTSPNAPLPPHLDQQHKDVLRDLKSTYEPEFWQLLSARAGGAAVPCAICNKETATKLHHGFFSFLNPDAVGGLGRDGLLMYGVAIWDIVIPCCDSDFTKTDVNERSQEITVKTTCLKEAEEVARSFVGRVWGGKPISKVGVKCQGCGKVWEGDPLSDELVGEDGWGRAMRKELKRCTGCRSVGYCGRECQKKGWKEHKYMCPLLGGAAKARFEIDKAIQEEAEKE
ncbi:hypothetical protein BJ508DRAFT_412630 [Ascobolus immersus RN42]|uniref:MYND-type domain-containing protein n=1 Tax=Ascobolus immersus RN42 TaxID=1160509 RepID=A0A3N4IGJ4_ASCIM|nr:hypothetical protein BJ508DRAFT_412630 [Ascobolus immersus RN42]